jgi:hypothetical protein
LALSDSKSWLRHEVGHQVMMMTAKSVQTTVLRLREAELSIEASRRIQTSAIDGHRPDVTAVRSQTTVVDLGNQEISMEMVATNVARVVMVEETTHGANAVMSGVVTGPTIVVENLEHQGAMT